MFIPNSPFAFIPILRMPNVDVCDYHRVVVCFTNPFAQKPLRRGSNYLHRCRSYSALFSVPMDPETLSRRVSDQTQNDASLINTTAVDIARALNLEGNNRTLGRKFVRMAVSSSTFEVFKDNSKEYAALPLSLQQKIFDSTKQKAASVLAQMQQGWREREEGNIPQQPGGITGFSGRTESLETSQNIVRGGLIRGGNASKHEFQRPEGGMSALGLDKLARLKDKTRQGPGLVSMAESDGDRVWEESREDEDEGEDGTSGSSSKGGTRQCCLSPCIHVNDLVCLFFPCRQATVPVQG